MWAMRGSCVALVAVLTASACGEDGTFVVVEVDRGGGGTPITKYEATLSYGSTMGKATVDLAGDDQLAAGPLSFSLELDAAEAATATLGVIAYNGTSQLASGTAMVDVRPGETSNVMVAVRTKQLQITPSKWEVSAGGAGVPTRRFEVLNTRTIPSARIVTPNAPSPAFTVTPDGQCAAAGLSLQESCAFNVTFTPGSLGVVGLPTTPLFLNVDDEQGSRVASSELRTRNLGGLHIMMDTAVFDDFRVPPGIEAKNITVTNTHTSPITLSYDGATLAGFTITPGDVAGAVQPCAVGTGNSFDLDTSATGCTFKITFTATVQTTAALTLSDGLGDAVTINLMGRP